MSLEGWTGLSVGLPKAERTTILYSESDTRRLAVTQATAKASKGRAQSPLAAPAGAEPCLLQCSLCKEALPKGAGASGKPLLAPAGAKPCFSPGEKKEYHPKGEPHAELFV